MTLQPLRLISRDFLEFKGGRESQEPVIHPLLNYELLRVQFNR